MILELRFETLWDHVDYFVIAEAVYTQVGKPKPLNFDIHRFAKYKSKIRYLTVDHFPPGPMSAWKNENYQRNCLIDGLYDASDDDWVIVSDLDEIPRPETIPQYNPKRYKRADFKQKAYAYYLNNLLMDGDKAADWFGSKVTTYRHLKEFFRTATAVRSYKSSGLLRLLKRNWFKTFQVQIIEDGGWHFTWMLKPENIVTKMEAIAEQNFVKEEFKKLDYIQSKIGAGEDVMNPKSHYAREAVVEPVFPSYLVAHKDKYSEWFR
jgi:beta-1,4-mannosyl-glycoprotein beta-1,4-N-acetylglucosaminyltransferase